MNVRFLVPVRMVCAVAILGAVGCSGPARQVDYYDFDLQKPLNAKQLLFKSSAVIVGTVKSVNIVRSGVPARKDRGFLLDETQVTVDVENVLRGNQTQCIKFEFFGYSGKNRGGYVGPGLYRVVAGERSIFFLTVDDGHFRSVGDLRGGYSFRVSTGLHRGFRRSEPPGDAISGGLDGREVGDDISAILLELGDHPDSQALASTLGQAAYYSDELALRKATVRRLLKLVGDQDRSLSLRACLLLAEQYAGQSGCLSRFAQDPTLSPSERKDIVEMQSRRKLADQRLKGVLRKQPMAVFGFDSVVAVRDELELLSGDPDPELRQLSCDVLRRDFPYNSALCK
jgi:hypothetical protein